MDAGFTLNFHGMNGSKAVLRLSAPVAQSEANPEYEDICGVWLFPRNGRDIVIEKPVYAMIGDPVKWQESQEIAEASTEFGINDSRVQLEGGARQASCKLARTAEEFAEYTKDIADIANVITPEWVDWKREGVLVIFPGEMRVYDGIRFTTAVVAESGASANNNGGTGKSKAKYSDLLTYHLTAPSGVDPGTKTMYAFVKINKPTRTLVVKQSLTAGPGPADVKEVARFEE
jgi:hypothetical protein